MESADGSPRWCADGRPGREEETGPGPADGPRRIRRTVGVLVTPDLTGSARRVR
ncbi:hypothetical protein [Streptomyces sp. HF10]|uniref:hypothetical protein n=1 Tax=Streptomyces sp. HF10 TaxID=2692233 RepID=UPI001315E19F|nr:hypothetical protein [Streptomyces sp. HF10]QHC29193.1 hypothetical protein GR129_10510 [Streptomyces sp. HF10]